MENRDKEFLFEVKKALTDLKNQIEEIENRIAEYEQSSENKDIEVAAIDLNIDDEIAIKHVAEIDKITETEQSSETKEATEIENITITSEDVDTVEEDVNIEDKETAIVEVEAAPAKKETDAKEEAVIDTYADRQPWRRDMPGSHVNDIRSAISLNDRILFINTLFDEDPIKFQNTVTTINSMTTLKEVIEMIERDYPKWNMDSEIVYRFMMAVRRRVK